MNMMMKTRLIQIIEMVVNQLVNIIRKVFSWFNNKTWTQGTQYDASTEFDRMVDEFMLADEDIYDNKWHEVADMSHVKKNRGEMNTKTDDDKPTMKPHRYHIKNDTISVRLDTTTKIMSKCLWIKTQKNDALTYMTLNDQAVVMAKIKMLNKLVTVVPTHALQGMGLNELRNYWMLNPMIHASIKVYKLTELPVLQQNAKMFISTVDVNLRDYYIIQTQPIQLINAIIKTKNRYKKATIGAILHVDKQHSVIWSGSLIECSGNALVVSSITEREDGLVILVAWTVAGHDMVGTVE